MDIGKEIDQKVFVSEYQKLLINILYTSKFLEYNHSRHFKEYALTAQQFNILRILRGNAGEPATIAYLTARMLDKSSNASRLVDKLADKGLVLRRICPSNKRAVDVTITKVGLDTLEKLDQHPVLTSPALDDVISQEDAQAVNALLDKLREHFKPALI
jgi:DNA-binding MarR family transcriptional regulator